MSNLPETVVPLVDLAAQYQTIAPDVDAAIRAVLSRTNFILGEQVDRFERAFAAYCESEHGVGLDSGTSALELTFKAVGIGPGDEVITAANTFVATALAISYCGATPVLVDIDPETYALDPARLEAAITPRTRAIVPVHLYGHPADMAPIMALAARHDLVVIEDASQAHGARYRGRRVGSIGHAGVFSLYPAKNLGAYGDAGVVVTNDAAIAKQLRLLRNYGSTRKYFHEIRGYNRRLDTLHAAVLEVKLRHLDRWNDGRRRAAEKYDELLAGTAAELPSTASDVEPVYHLYVVRHAARDQLQEQLRAVGISTGIHYPVPVHLQPAYADLGYRAGDFPITEQVAREILSLPMYPELPDEAIVRTASAIKSFSVNGMPAQGPGGDRELA